MRLLPSPRWLFASSSTLLLLTLLLLTSSPSGHAGTPPVKNPVIIPPAESHPMYLGTITSGIKTSDSYTEGNFSIVAPVYSTLGADATLSGGMAFLEPYVSYGEGGEIAASLGLGYRHLFGSQPVSALYKKDTPQAGLFTEGFFVGSSVFIDMLDTEANNQFWQLGVGLEVGTRYFEVRGNYYIPLSDRQLAEETRSRESFQNTSRRSSTTAGLSDPYATGNTIAQDAIFTTRTTTTTTTTTIERLFRRYEEGMEGWDAEVALLVPGLDQYFDFRVIGGYYAFDNQPFGPQTGGTGNVEGWKAGVEIRPVPAVILSGMWYEDDRLTGSDWTVGVQLQIPFEAGDLGDGKGFWGRIGESFKPRRRHLAERMAEPVRRQNAAVKLANTVETDTSVSSKTKTSSSTSEARTMIVLVNDVVFVNNGGAVGNGIQAGVSSKFGGVGTAEKPVDTVNDGAYIAGTNSNDTGRLWTVYTQGGTGADSSFGIVNVVGNTRFTSSFLPLTAMGGKTFGGNTARPSIQGGFGAESIETLIISGYEVYGGLDSYPGLSAYNVADLTVTDSSFHDFQSIAIAVYADAGNGVSAYFENNRFGGQADLVADPAIQNSGIMFDSSGTGTVINAEVFENRFHGTHLLAIGGTTSGTATLNLDILDSFLTGTFVGYDPDLESGEFHTPALGFFSDDDSTQNINVLGTNFVGDFEAFAIGAESRGTSDLNLNVEESFFTGEFYSAIATYKGDDSVMDVFVNNNRFYGKFHDDAIELIGGDSSDANDSMLTAAIRGNLFSGYFDADAIEVRKEWEANVDVDIINNNFSGDFDFSAIRLEAYAQSDGKLTGSITHNDFSGEFDEDVIKLYTDDTGVLSVKVTDNTAPGTVSDNFLHAQSAGNSKLKVKDMISNNLSGTGGTAFLFYEQGGDLKVNAKVSDITLTNLINLIDGYTDIYDVWDTDPSGEFLVNENEINLP
jgi:hypothetical protein